jgi:hypothetical protein
MSMGQQLTTLTNPFKSEGDLRNFFRSAQDYRLLETLGCLDFHQNGNPPVSLVR